MNTLGITLPRLLLIAGITIGGHTAVAQESHAGHAMNEHDMQHVSQQTQTNQPQEGLTVFGTVQQIVAQLEADPSTDWSQIDIPSLQQHLVDMEFLSLFTSVESRDVRDGAEFTIRGEGRALEAIHRMVPMHAQQIADDYGWQTQVETRSDGAVLRVAASGKADMVRAIGFLGFMSLGDHHTPHHLVMGGIGTSDDATMDHSTHESADHNSH